MNEENVNLNVVPKLTLFARLPKWLRAILLLVSIITVIYWLGFSVYKFLSALRVIGAFIFDKRNYWTAVWCILILCVGAILLGQFYFELDPIGKLIEFITPYYERLTSYLTNLLP